MYIHIHKDIQCGKCKSVNNYETVTPGGLYNNKTFRRCKSCGYEALQSTLTSTQNIAFQPINSIYNGGGNKTTTF